jgi:hypothetical protein
MAKPRIVAQFIAALKQSTPGAKPVKFGPDGESDISLETDAQQMREVMKLVGRSAEVFKITIEELPE